MVKTEEINLKKHISLHEIERFGCEAITIAYNKKEGIKIISY